MDLATRDRKIIWHPLTQEKLADLPMAIKRAHGSYIYDEQGRAYLDLISSWWVTLHGHSHPKIAEAIYEQALKLEQLIFAGFTHEAAVTLCEKLSSILPAELCRFFFSDNGSTAVEIALKMAYKYWWNKDQSDRTVFLCMEGGYHGSTFGAMSVGRTSGFFNAYEKLFFRTVPLPYPSTWDGDMEVAEKEKQALAYAEQYLAENAKQVAAFIVEPLIQGASGMRICRPEFLDALLALIKSYDILVIFDEVMTGFGRVGTNFALEQLTQKPDLLCLSKGLTGGFLPLSLTVATNRIYEAFLGDDYKTAFSHSHSYTANPLGCAAAIASLALLLAAPAQEAIKNLNQAHKNGMAVLDQRVDICKLRIIGTIAAFDINCAIGFDEVQQLKRLFLKEGMLIRPLDGTCYLMPPYSTTHNEIMEVYDKIAAVLIDFRPALKKG
jgi:adenosylmethionine-8-amino-7-oxononanoate aminotransferase